MKVRIFKPHTHAGTRYVPGPDGLVIDVPADAAQWLIAHAGAVAVGGAGPRTRPSVAEPAAPPDPLPDEPPWADAARDA